MSDRAMSPQQQQSVEIQKPHDHDVLSGRGNFVNYHAGNEHFRGLVRKHKVAYVACPKPQKGQFSKMIVEEILSRNPPGRFLKQDAKTKLWYDIGEKKALDKTRQALREGAPEIQKELGDDAPSEKQSPSQTFIRDVSSPHALGHAPYADIGGSYDGYGDAIAPLSCTQDNPSMNSRHHQPQHYHLGQHNVGKNYDMSNSPGPGMTYGIHSTLSPGTVLAQQQQMAALAYPQHQNNNMTYPSGIQTQGQNNFHVGTYGGRPDQTPQKFSTFNDGYQNQIQPPRVTEMPMIAMKSSYRDCVTTIPLRGSSSNQRKTTKNRGIPEDHFEASTSSLVVDSIFSGEKSATFDLVSPTKSRSNKFNSSGISTMSMSMNGIGDPDVIEVNNLGPLFNSSLKLGGHSVSTIRPTRRLGSGEESATEKTAFDMSVNTLEELGDSAHMPMTDSQAEMSFANVFDEGHHF